MRMKTLIRTGITTLLFFAISPIISAQRLAPPHPYLHRGEVWEPELEIAEGVVLPGFWRPEYRRGYAWVDTYEDEYGRWYRGYWRPINEHVLPEGAMVWVPGYRSGGRWVPGYWRPPVRQGYVWGGGYYDPDGYFHEPHWELSPPE